MGKAIGRIALGGAIVGAAFLTGGASLVAAPGLIGTTVATTALGGMAFTAGVGLALSGAASAIGLGPKVPAATLSALDRLNATMVPTAPRKAVYGYTAMATDIRYIEPSGENQEYVDAVLVVAAHAVRADLSGWAAA